MTIDDQLKRLARTREPRVRPLAQIERRAQTLRQRRALFQSVVAVALISIIFVGGREALTSLDRGRNNELPSGEASESPRNDSSVDQPPRLVCRYVDLDESLGLCGSWWLRSILSEAGFGYSDQGSLFVFADGRTTFFVFVERPVYADPLQEARDTMPGPVDPQSPLWEHNGTTIYSTWDGHSKENVASFYFRAGGVDIHPGLDAALDLPDQAATLRRAFEQVIDAANANPYDPASLPRFLPPDSDRWLVSTARPTSMRTCSFDPDYQGRCYLLEAQIEVRTEDDDDFFKAWAARPTEKDPDLEAEKRGMRSLWEHGATVIYSDPLLHRPPETVRFYWRAGGGDVWTEAYFPLAGGAATMESVRRVFEVMIDEANRNPYDGP